MRFLSTKGHFGRGHVLHTLSRDILHPHIYSSVLLVSKLQWSKKKKKKKKKVECMPLNEVHMKEDWSEHLQKVLPGVKATSPIPFPR